MANHSFSEEQSEAAFLIIHGMSGRSDDHWYPWLVEELESRGHRVINETFPENLKTKKEITMQFLRDLVKDVDGEDLIIITHSSGCAPAFLFAEKNKLKGIVTIGGLFEDLGYKEEKESGLFEDGFDWGTIKSNVKHRYQIDSDNDVFMSNEHFDELEKKFDSIHIKLKNRQHFGNPGYSPKTFPELLELLSEIA